MTMASKELSILLTAKDLASKTIGQVGRNVQKLDSVSARAGRGMRTLATNTKRLAVIGAGAGIGLLTVSVKKGIENLAILGNATQSLEGSIKQLGLTGQVTASQIVGWAGEIETAVGAAFDDKDIAAATSTLMRYGKVTPANLRPAMVVMTDLAAKTGSVASASTLLARALADPANAAGKLTRAGVILTDAQKKQLASFGKLTKNQQKHYLALRATNKAEAEAYKKRILARRAIKGQAEVLELLTETTAGAALDSQDEYTRSLKLMGEAVEDAQMALAVGFLPVIQRVSEWITKGLADKGTMDNIKRLGQNLADAASGALDFLEKVDWKSIGSGLKMAADWAGTLVGAISKMPPEALAAIVALGGLNKLSGGAISGIVGELGKGLIKGVLGMTAGVVNITAGVVSGPGGLPGTPTAGGGKGGGVSRLVKDAGRLVPGVGVGVVVGQEMNRQTGSSGQGSDTWTKALADKWFRAGQASASAPSSHSQERGIEKAVTDTGSDTRAEQIATKRAVAEGVKKQAESLVAFRAGERTSATGLSTVATTTRTSAAATAIAQATSASRIVSAIAANRPITNVYVYASGANVKYGAKTGSAGTGSGGGGASRIPT
jgi:hypothetical protein